jgi:Tol biopolymer transport system component
MNPGVLCIRDLTTGQERELSPKLSFFIGPRWSPDGRPSIVVRDLESGREEEAHRAPAGSSVNSFALSPDGQSVVFRSYDEVTRVAALQVIPSTGGPPRELFRAAKGENIPGHTGLFWSPDGSQVFFTKGGTAGQDLTFELWRVPAQGGEAQEVGLTMEFLREVRVHPDGKRIAFAAGWSGTPEVWVMENVPRPTGSAK